MEDIKKVDLNEIEYKITDTDVKKQYPTLELLPTINGITVVGDLSLATLGIQPRGEYARYQDIPFRTSDLANDKNYQTYNDVMALIAEELAKFEHTEYVIVDHIPTPGEAQEGKVYLVSNGTGYDQYIKVGSQVVALGSTSQVDLSNYYSKAEVDTKLSSKANAADIPTATNQLNNNSGFITNQTTGLQYYMKTADIQNALNGKADKSEVKSKTSQLENDAQFQTKTQMDLADTATLNAAKAYTDTKGADKQDKLTAGDGIKIASNVISLSDDMQADIDNLTSNVDTLEQAVDALQTNKQNKLTAGDNIQISASNVISATDTKYTAGENVQISAANVITATDTKYTAGNGLTLSGTSFSVNDTYINALIKAYVDALDANNTGY